MHLLNTGRPKEALPHLKLAFNLDPKDQQAAFSLAEACKAAGELGEADAAYLQAIALNEYSDLAEKARVARREFAYEGFRAGGYSGTRPDAVMFCLSALKRFQGMSAAEINKINLEIALLGRKGLDVHDPEPKYSLKGLKGSFSGLQLLSMMYVGFKAVAPDKDIGFDLGQEYRVALALHQGKKGK
jgi:tetratricopeptide (TPR) repeat protein